MYEYKCKIVRVVDGDTVDVDVDLGFGVWLQNERVRIAGIDTPECRTSDEVERIFGNLAKETVKKFLPEGSYHTLRSHDYKGKFGRILGDIIISKHNLYITEILLAGNLAVLYDGQSKLEIEQAHLDNRKRLLEQGLVDVEQYNAAVALMEGK